MSPASRNPAGGTDSAHGRRRSAASHAHRDCRWVYDEKFRMSRKRKRHVKQLAASQVAGGIGNDGHNKARDSGKSVGQKIDVDGYARFALRLDRGVSWFDVANTIG